MIRVIDPISMDFDSIDVDPYWSTSNEREHKGHRIHSYPAKFPAFITQKAIEFANRDNVNINCIADLFCGCGTVAFEAKRLGIDFWGCDLNPVAVLIAKTKSARYERSIVEKYFKKIMTTYDYEYQTHQLTNPTNDRIKYWFNQREIVELDLLKKSIFQNIPIDSDYHNFFLCAFSNILKATSRWLTKSIKPQIDPQKTPASAREAFSTQCSMMQTAIAESNITGARSKTIIEQKDALTIRKKAFADLIVTSPPYVTSYEYADLHQLSALWLDYAEDYRELRRNSIGSLHSYQSPPEPDNLNSTGSLIYTSLSSIDKSKANNVAKYYLSMQKITDVCKDALKPGGMMLMVIGNTEYKGVHIDNVKHLTESMIQSGFEQVFVTKRKISGKNLTPYRDAKGRFSSDQNKRMVYSEEFIVVGR